MSRPVLSTALPASTATVNANDSLTLQTATSSLNGTVTATVSRSSAVLSSVGGGGGGSSRRRRRRSLGASSSNRTTFQYSYNNSAGPPVIFALDVSPLRILPPAGFIRAPNGIFRTILALDQPAENTVDVTCSLETVPPGSDINNRTELCSSPPADTVTFANSSVTLKLTAKEIQFEKGELYKKIDLTLTGSPAERTGSLVRVACCGKDTGVSLRYNNESAVVFAWVELRKLQPVDWDRITSDQRTTTSGSDIDLDCPCNLKENTCDVGCCCDQDCSDFEHAKSSCIPGFFGGASSERPFEFSCQATWPDATDWQPFLCVTINNSPVIGYFYNFSSPPSAQDTLSFSTLEEKKTRPRFSFSESEERYASVSSSLYLAGTTIKTAANTDEANYARAVLGVLSLPQGVFTRLCSQTAPVRFLEEFVSSCVHELEESLCSSSSAVSALNYLMPIKLNQPACPLPPAVLAEGRLNQTLGGPPKLAVTEVQYFCTDINKYVSMTTEGSDDMGKNDTTSLFKSNSPQTDSAERCEFDDGQTKPPAPDFNKTTRFCSNVVVKVEYEFSWRGRQVTEVLARVTLGNVKIPAIQGNAGFATSQTPIHALSQTFSVKFRHSAQNSSSGQTLAQRSGNPGYFRGRPVLSRLLTNSTQASPGKIHLWSAAGDSLCADASSTPVLFGQDTFSGCLLQLSLEDLRNCTQMKHLVRTNQDRLLQATHVGRRGNADQAVADDWLPIIREPFNSTTNGSVDSGICPGIPSGVLIEMLVSEAGQFRGVPQMEVVGTRISYQYTTWKFQCMSGFGVSCSFPASNRTNASFMSLLPSPSVSITPSNSLVSENATGVSANQSVANLSASASTFLGNHSRSSDDETADTKTTSSYGPRFQYFLVSSSVVFIKVPSEKPARVKRSLDQTGICYHDVCKEELFLPLTEAYTGEPRQKAMALSLFLIFLSLVIFAVSRPWG